MGRLSAVPSLPDTRRTGTLTAAVVPHPPLLLPALAGSGDDDLAALRAACHAAVAGVAASADVLLLAGVGRVWGLAMPGARASFGPYGARVHTGLPRGGPRLRLDDRVPDPTTITELPLSLAVLAWLLEAITEDLPTVAVSLPASMPPPAAAETGRAVIRALADGRRRIGLLVAADGSACRQDHPGVKPPGGFHPDAAATDRAVTAALAAGDLPALLAVDTATAARVRLDGRVPLQLLASAFDGHRPVGEVLYEGAPYGVGYTVATWRDPGAGVRPPVHPSAAVSRPALRLAPSPPADTAQPSPEATPPAGPTGPTVRTASKAPRPTAGAPVPEVPVPGDAGPDSDPSTPDR